MFVYKTFTLLFFLLLLLGFTLGLRYNYHQSFCQKESLLDIICHAYNCDKFLNLSCLNKIERKINFDEWSLVEKQLLMRFPIDTEVRNYVREVRNAIFSHVLPRSMNDSLKLAALSGDVLSEILEIDMPVANNSNFVAFVSGNKILKGSTPLAHRYGGHQFGYWAGQLGDGRAHILGEYVTMDGDRWELQLKGSGKTPYSRRGDGYAVIRSSVREFLCSEAMHYLGIPTSRAATLVVSDDPVIRDQFYNGNFKQERAAVVMRLAKSWFRYGSLEILAYSKEIELLRILVDFIIEQYFCDIDTDDSNKFLSFFSKVVEQTAEMIAKWQSVGFTHGVCNTDNFSILSITIDYGPFGFLDEYNPEFVPNTSDDEGRYSYEKQPDVGYFNLNKLRIALNPLLNPNQQSTMHTILNGYNNLYKQYFMTIFRNKLGLAGEYEVDEEIVAYLIHMMTVTKADFTMTFRNLGDWPYEDIKKGYVNDQLWSLKLVSVESNFKYWRELLVSRLKQTTIPDIERRQNMHKINPRYVLRNWMAQIAIKDTEKDDFRMLNKIHNILRRPFEEQREAEELGFADPPPEWAKQLRVSCSS